MTNIGVIKTFYGSIKANVNKLNLYINNNYNYIMLLFILSNRQ